VRHDAHAAELLQGSIRLFGNFPRVALLRRVHPGLCCITTPAGYRSPRPSDLHLRRVPCGSTSSRLDPRYLKLARSGTRMARVSFVAARPGRCFRTRPGHPIRISLRKKTPGRVMRPGR